MRSYVVRNIETLSVGEGATTVQGHRKGRGIREERDTEVSYVWRITKRIIGLYIK